MTKRGNTLKLLAMFVLGSLIATVIALLLAPRSGKEARAQIKSRGLGFAARLRTIRQRTKDTLGLKRISNWGNYPQAQVKFYEFEDRSALRELLAS